MRVKEMIRQRALGQYSSSRLVHLRSWLYARADEQYSSSSSNGEMTAREMKIREERVQPTGNTIKRSGRSSQSVIGLGLCCIYILHLESFKLAQCGQFYYAGIWFNLRVYSHLRILLFLTHL